MKTVNKTLIFIFAFFAFCFFNPLIVSAKNKCNRCDLIDGFKEFVRVNGGTINVVKVKNGLMIVVTSEKKATPSKIQDAAKDLISKINGLNEEKSDTKCKIFLSDLNENKVSVGIDKIENGVLISEETVDPSALNAVLSDACSWCICRSGGTNDAGCASCCGS